MTDGEGRLWKSYRYSPTGDITFGKPKYNNSYAYNAEDYNPNLELQYLRARYYDVERGNFLTEDSYLGRLTEPLTLNRYNYVKSSALNYIDPSGYLSLENSLNGTIIQDPNPDKVEMYMPDSFVEQSERRLDSSRDSIEDRIEQAELGSYISSCDPNVKIRLVDESMWQYQALQAISEMRNENGYTSYGLSGGGNLMIWSGSISVAIVVDGKGNIVLITGKAFNVGTPDVGLSVSGFQQIVPNVSNYLETDPDSTQIGGTISGELTGLPILTGEEFIEVTAHGKKYKGTTHLTGVSMSLSPVEIHAGSSRSQTQYSINILEKAEDIIWSTVGKQ